VAKFFGTDGIRGKANEVLTPEMAFILGKAAASVLCDSSMSTSHKILIGKDTRVSGDMLEAALAAGICSAGASPVLLGVIPTPGVAVLCREYGAMAGAVISASHNPFEDNGIKFFSGNGYKLPDLVEEKIEHLMVSPTPAPSPVGGDIGKISYDFQSYELYLNRLREQQPLDLKGLKIVIDCANGASSHMAEELFASLGANVVAIADKPDGCNINLNCGSTHIQGLASEVVRQQAQIGIAFDGDADRMLAVDEKGNILDGDFIMAICAAHMKEKNELKNNLLVVTVLSNMGLHIAMKKLGITVSETKVGDRYILERMLELDAVLGGEQSGHLIFSKYNTTGDGLASALYLLSVIQSSGKPISELAKVMHRLPQLMINVPVRQKAGWEDDAEIMAAYNAGKEVLAGVGRVLLRPSGTENLLRVMAEGENEEQVKTVVEDIVEVIRKKRGIPK